MINIVILTEKGVKMHFLQNRSSNTYHRVDMTISKHPSIPQEAHETGSSKTD